MERDLPAESPDRQALLQVRRGEWVGEQYRCVTPGEASEASRGKGVHEAVGQWIPFPSRPAGREPGNDTVRSAHDRMGHRSQDRGVQLVPLRVRPLDQSDLPGAVPALQLLFSCYRLRHLAMDLEPDEPV